MKNTQNYRGASGSLNDKIAPTEEGIQNLLSENKLTEKQQTKSSTTATNADLLQKGLQSEAAITKSQNVFDSLENTTKKSQ